ncbi:hypothetical protein HC251_15845 [Iamia sp. SCSIO 61187]|uniref:hypothetical protein n=1 Tax=Iamia sp. SCSIO 61187 TaxID=2722752 RepID=UPI001C626785|nr:hypothetical protein [Iamia sp. SCSIO 61187]QYG93752.1 hypothetical protein HC251_15845 [Iamia sp. SCSIO 61187]
MEGSYDRRIGDRVDVESVPVLWRAPAPGAPRWKQIGKQRPQSGALLDLSVSGLQVRAPAADDLFRGVVIHIQLDGVTGAVVIRRVTPVPGTKLCDYGVQLKDTATELTQWVHERLARSAPVRESDWNAPRR